jgi:hypothetical protein
MNLNSDIDQSTVKRKFFENFGNGSVLDYTFVVSRSGALPLRKVLSALS